MIQKYLKGNAAYLKKYIILDENDALSEYNKIPLGHNRTNVFYCIVLRPYTTGPIGPLSYRHSSGVVRNQHSALAV